MKSECRTSNGIALVFCFLACLSVAAQDASIPGKDSTKQQAATLPQISGHVYRADTGVPIEKAVVTLYTTIAKSDGKYPTAETDHDGAYHFFDVRPNTYTLAASCEGFVREDYSRDGTLEGKFLAIKPGIVFQNVDFRLALAGVISGSVSDEHDSPVRGIEVSAVRLQFSPGGSETRRRVQVTKTKEDGTFRLAGLTPGFYYVCVNGPNGSVLPTVSPAQGWTYRETYYRNASSTEGAQRVQVVAGDETKEIHISVSMEKRYSISGRIAGPGQENEASHYRYDVWVQGRNHTASMKDDGSFTIPDIPAGDYTLRVTAWGDAGYVGQGTAVVHVIDSDVHVEVKVGGLGEVSGRAVLPGSQEESFAGMRLLIHSDSALNPSAFDATGRFDIQRVLPGNYSFELTDSKKPIYIKQVRCSGRDYTTQPITIESGQVVTDCEVILYDDTGMVQGKVTDGNKPASGPTVVLIPESSELRKIARYTLAGKTTEDGHFEISKVIPGDYLLFAVAPTDDHAYFAIDFADRNRGDAVRVNVTSRKTQTVDLKLITALNQR